MSQLGELKKNQKQFEDHDVEIIAIFREESKGIEGLELIKKKTKVDFTLGLDTPAEKTAKYSPKKMEFDSYVVDKTGTIREIVNGDLRNRAKAKQLLEAIETIDPKPGEPDK